MKKAAIDTVKLAAGMSLVPGPDIADDGDCLLAAANSQVFYLKSYINIINISNDFDCIFTLLN